MVATSGNARASGTLGPTSEDGPGGNRGLTAKTVEES